MGMLRNAQVTECGLRFVWFAWFDVYFLANLRIFDLRPETPMKFADMLFAD